MVRAKSLAWPKSALDAAVVEPVAGKNHRFWVRSPDREPALMGPARLALFGLISLDADVPLQHGCPITRRERLGTNG
jgi:hypothetical protein